MAKKDANPNLKNKAIVYRLYPTKEQIKYFSKCFGCSRFVWNKSLELKKTYYKENKKSITITPAMLKGEFPFLKEVDSLALANVQLNLQTAYSNHFKNPKHFGFPNFKKKKNEGSYTTNNQHEDKTKGKSGTIALVSGGIKLPKVGIVKAKLHRLPKDSWTLKSATVSRNAEGKYYVSVLFEYEEEVVPTVGTNAVGLDYKSDGFYVDSDGKELGSPKYYRKVQRRLRRLQKACSRRKGSKKGEVKSKNYEKALKKKAKLEAHVANQRKDFQHKVSTEIANQYDIVCVEDLNLQGMKSSKGFKLGKSTSDNGWGSFVFMLSYKLSDRGKHLVKVGRWFPSSQLCNVCGYKNKEVKDMKVRDWVCPVCGVHHDRDHNAAINILNEGLRILKEESELKSA